MSSEQLSQKLWNLCNVLRDDGITYHEYVTELTYILFLKMAKEIGIEKVKEKNKNGEIETVTNIPDKFNWDSLTELDGIELLKKYREALTYFSNEGTPEIKTIYINASTKIEEPKNIKKIFNEIDKMDWYSVDRDDMGNLYESLLEKNASEKKSGAGQYFTPRVLIDCMVRIIKPALKETIFDPAAGTCGFLIAAKNYLNTKYDSDRLSIDDFAFQKRNAYYGCELVTDTHRLATMNLLLHGIDGKNIHPGDTLSEFGKRFKDYDIILSNPPFGTKKGGERATRDDINFETSNKQLNFLQVIYTSLNKTSKARAAIVLPDNVLFEGGVGEKVRKELLQKFNLHTILRLPTGIFYAQGVKTNVLFFNRTSKDTKEVWFYDLRTNMDNFGKTNQLKAKDFEEFEETILDEKKKNKIERWTKYSIAEIEKKKYSLDLGLIKDDSIIDHEDLPNPIESAEETIEKLEEAVDLLKSVVKELKLCGLKK